MDCQVLSSSLLKKAVSKLVVFYHFCNGDSWFEFKMYWLPCGRSFFTCLWLVINLCKRVLFM